jgi:hypothetical protein
MYVVFPLYFFCRPSFWTRHTARGPGPLVAPARPPARRPGRLVAHARSPARRFGPRSFVLRAPARNVRRAFGPQCFPGVCTMHCCASCRRPGSPDTTRGTRRSPPIQEESIKIIANWGGKKAASTSLPLPQRPEKNIWAYFCFRNYQDTGTKSFLL